MNNTNENTLTTDERKFLDENFKKRTTLKVALKKLGEIQLKFLKEKAEQIIEKYPLLFNEISEGDSLTYDIYVSLPIRKGSELRTSFKNFEFGVCYWEYYRCDKWYGFYPYAGTYPNKKNDCNSVSDDFKKNTNSDIIDKEEIEIDEDGVWLYLKDDWDSRELKNYAKTLDELSQQFDMLCEEVIRLMKDYSKKHK